MIGKSACQPRLLCPLSLYRWESSYRQILQTRWTWRSPSKLVANGPVPWSIRRSHIGGCDTATSLRSAEGARAGMGTRIAPHIVGIVSEPRRSMGRATMNGARRMTPLAGLAGVLTFATLVAAVAVQWRPLAAQPGARDEKPKAHPLDVDKIGKAAGSKATTTPDGVVRLGWART